MMSRPIYEQAVDLAREHDIMSLVSAKWGVQYYKLPMSYRLDFILMSAEKPKAFVECKHRNFVWGKYPDVMISMSKVMAAEQMLQVTGLKTMFVVRATDRIFYTQLNRCAGNLNWLKFGGRTATTRDDGDIEPVYHIPIEEFSEL
jgi:hypothetical protein